MSERAFDPESGFAALSAVDTVTITTEEYKALVRDAAMLELIHRCAVTAKYSSDIEHVVRATMQMVGVSEAPEEE